VNFVIPVAFVRKIVMSEASVTVKLARQDCVRLIRSMRGLAQSSRLVRGFRRAPRGCRTAWRALGWLLISHVTLRIVRYGRIRRWTGADQQAAYARLPAAG
jgi:hypothetical protein